jgi:hypothetical protein
METRQSDHPDHVTLGGGHGQHGAAADQAVKHHSVEVRLPVLGRVQLPSSGELAFLGGLGTLALVGVLEWPVAAALAVGHALSAKHRNRTIQEFGEALDHA